MTGYAPNYLVVTGGKGGIGSSNLAANLAVCLGRWGRRVLLVDCEAGPAGLDVLLGLGCENFQGYLFSRPLPPASVDAIFRPSLGPGSEA